LSIINLNIIQTGDDTETLRKVEALIKATFKSGKPPHLQPNAKSMQYLPGSDQSRIFVASHLEFSSMGAIEIQSILRERIILVHGNPLDYSYGWDLESFGRLYDVDKKVSIQGKIGIACLKSVCLKVCLVSTLVHPIHPDLCHRQATLREFHAVTGNEDCPPLNAISLSAHRRSHYVPSQFMSMASHEIAQSRVPSNYETRFQVPDLKSRLEWSLIGKKGTISPFHVDPDGLGTVVLVLEGSKYWIMATRFGEQENLTSVDALGPSWNPYFINDGDKAKLFRFEAVHLQKGDML
jgi:hypothetical protein